MASAVVEEGENTSGKWRRRRRGNPWRALGQRFGFLPRVWRMLERLSARPLLTALPLGIYMFVGAVYFLALSQFLTNVDSYPMFWNSAFVENEADKLATELFKQKIQAFGYLLTFFLLLFRTRQCVAFFRAEKTVLLLLLALLASMLGSDYPDRVVINFIHLVMGFLATWVYFSDVRRQANVVFSACLIAFVPVMLVLGGSFLLFFIHRDTSLVAILGGARFSGLVGNPNSLGGVCITGAWATFGLMSLTPVRSRRMVYLVLALGIVLFDTWATGSATATAIITGMALMLVCYRFYSVLGRKARAGLLLGGTLAFFAIAFTLLVQMNVDEYALAATGAVGKDLTLTGRTDLWVIGWHAFLERPVFGWGYDNHQTVLETAQYGVPYNHYHNGYLDSLVSGGALLFAAILLSYVTFFRRYLSATRSIDTLFPLLVAVAAVSIQNLTEYSLFRNNTAVWQIYFIAFMAVSIVTVRPRNARRSAFGSGAPSSRHRSRSRQASW